MGPDCRTQTASAETVRPPPLPLTKGGEEIKMQALAKGLHLQILKETATEVTVLLSCSSLPVSDFLPACQMLQEVLDEEITLCHY